VTGHEALKYVALVKDPTLGDYTRWVKLDLAQVTKNTTIELVYSMRNIESNGTATTTGFKIDLFLPLGETPCTPELKIAEGIFPKTYQIETGAQPLSIDLSGVTNNNCAFELEVINLATNEVADPTMFLLTAPTFKSSDASKQIVTMTQPGNLKIQPLTPT